MSKVHSFFSSGDVTSNFWRATQNTVIAYKVLGILYCPDQQLVGKLLMSHTRGFVGWSVAHWDSTVIPGGKFLCNGICLCIYTDAYVLYIILGK